MKRHFFPFPKLRYLFRACAGLALLSLASAGNLVFAQDEDAAAAPMVDVQVNLSTFAQSELGELLVEAGTKIAAKEMEQDTDKVMEAVTRSVGFNPLEQDIKIKATIADPEEPVEGLRLDFQLKDSTGNLEGLLLTAPDYRSTKHGDQTIHVATIDDQDVYIVFMEDGNGRKRISAAGSKDVVTSILDGGSNGSRTEAAFMEMPEGQILKVRLLSLPNEISEIPPLAGIAQTITESSLALREDGDDLVARITLEASTDEKATQLQQLVQGGVAMIGLFKDEIRREMDDDEVASNLLSVLDQIEVTRDGNQVSVLSKIPSSLVIDFLREEAELPL